MGEWHLEDRREGYKGGREAMAGHPEHRRREMGNAEWTGGPLPLPPPRRPW